MPLDALARSAGNVADLLGYGGAGEMLADPFLPYVDHVLPHAMLLEGGGLLGVSRLNGFRVGLAGDAGRMADVVRHRAALNAIADENVEVFEWLVRHEGAPPLPARPRDPSPYARRFLADWQATLGPRTMANEWFLGVLVRPRRSPFLTLWNHAVRGARAAAALGGRLLGRPAPPLPDEYDPDLAGQLEDAFRIVHWLLRGAGPVRLGYRFDGPADDPERLAFSEIAEALDLVRTSKRSAQPLVHPAGMIGPTLATVDAVCHRRGFEIQADPYSTTSHHGCMYGIVQYPESLWPDRADDLLKLPGRFVQTTHYRFFNRTQAQEDMQFLLRIAAKEGDPALGGGDDIAEAIYRVASGKTVRGVSRWSLAVHADGDPSDDPAAVERSARARVDRLASEARTILANAGLRIAPETKGNKLSHAGQMPGAPRRTFVRPAKVDTEYVAALSSLAGYATGAPDPLWGPSLRLLTPGGTAFDHTLMVRGVAHGAALGPNGAGKTVFVGANIIAADALVREPHPRRPPGMQIVIDVDESHAQTILALDGAYTAIRGGGEDSGVVPWRLPDSRRVRAMLRSFIAGLCLLGGAAAVSDQDSKDIRDGVDFLMDVLAPEDRHLGVVRRFMGWGAGSAGGFLERWCREFDGDLAWAFDGTRHGLAFEAHLVGVDLTGVKDDKLVMPAMGNFLLWMASERMDGRRLVLWAEEAPAYLGVREFDAMGKALALRARKRNTGFWVVAQMVEHLLATEAGKAVLKQARQKVLFPYEGAEWEHYGPEGLNVPRPVFDMVKGKMLEHGAHTVLVVRADGESTLAQFDLSGPVMREHLRLLSGTTNSVRLLREVWAANDGAPTERKLAEFHRRYHEAAA